MIAQLTEGSRRAYAVLSQHVNPFNHAMQMPQVRAMIDMGTDKGRAIHEASLQLFGALEAGAPGGWTSA